jgi:GTP-binding protein YchF
MRIGIVGLPNVGKSTLFNALTKQQAQASNFPFTTIEPNVGIVAVPDERLVKLTELSKSAKTVPTSIEFVDIAGLVKDAHAGEGLGNKFLSHIREVDAIAHVVRFFDDPNVTHVANKVDPLADAETINTELALADLSTVEKLVKRFEDDVKKALQSGGQAGAKKAEAALAAIQRLQKHLEEGNAARLFAGTDEEKEVINGLQLLTTKPILYVANVSEEQIKKADEVVAEFSKQYSAVLAFSVKIEQELVELSDEERLTFLSEYGLHETGLARLITAGYKLLNLITFLTTGPDETRAWTVEAGSTAPQAAGKIHSDFEHGFIRAETVAYDDLIATGSYAAARAAGKVRDEGKSYIVKDGDIFVFKFSV